MAELRARAFPTFSGTDAWTEDPGMALHDWFAGHAPITLADALAIGGWDEVPHHDADRAAVWAVYALLRFEYADAMMAERQKRLQHD